MTPSSSSFKSVEITVWSQTTLNTASALAPPLFRANTLDPTWRPPSTPLSETRLGGYSNLRGDHQRSISPLPPSAVHGNDISRPASTNLPYTNSHFFNQQQFHARRASFYVGREYHSEPRFALPGLSALTSLAAAAQPLPVRYALAKTRSRKNRKLTLGVGRSPGAAMGRR